MCHALVLNEACGHELPGALLVFVSEQTWKESITYCVHNPMWGGYLDGFHHIPVDQITTALRNNNVTGAKVPMKEPRFISAFMS